MENVLLKELISYENCILTSDLDFVKQLKIKYRIVASELGN